jgi:outer membrane immunogenic protein
MSNFTKTLRCQTAANLALIAVAVMTPSLSHANDGAFDGFKAGIQAGWEKRSIDENVLPQSLNVTLDDDSSKFAYGGYVGYDRQIGDIVIGAEAAFNPNGATLNADIPGNGSIEIDSKWSVDFTGRAGVAVSPKVLVYGRVGWGVNRNTIRGFATGNSQALASETSNDDGLIFGGGAEFVLNNRLSLRAEYRRGEFGGSLSRDQILSGLTVRF